MCYNNSKSSNNWRGTGWESKGTSYSAERAVQSYIGECWCRKGGFNNLEDIPSFSYRLHYSIYLFFFRQLHPLFCKKVTVCRLVILRLAYAWLCLFVLFSSLFFSSIFSASRRCKRCKTSGLHFNIFHMYNLLNTHMRGLGSNPVGKGFECPGNTDLEVLGSTPFVSLILKP